MALARAVVPRPDVVRIGDPETTAPGAVAVFPRLHEGLLRALPLPVTRDSLFFRQQGQCPVTKVTYCAVCLGSQCILYLLIHLRLEGSEVTRLELRSPLRVFQGR